MLRLVCLSLFSLFACTAPAWAQEAEPATRVAVVDFGQREPGVKAADTLWINLKQSELLLLDRDQSRAAATGIGYDHSLNLTVQQSRDLGSVMGCDYYLLGDAQILRRSPSTRQPYLEAYASIFLVSARTGKLITWQRFSFESSEPHNSEALLLRELSGESIRNDLLVAIKRARQEEIRERTTWPDRSAPLIAEAPDDDAALENQGLKLPKPYRRLRPAYTTEAAAADVEATVDVLADIDVRGDVTRVEIVRWAGFGLDQATIDSVRQMRFFPAIRNGVATPLRVLLRYNFRKTSGT
jgi:TonB family protein